MKTCVARNSVRRHTLILTLEKWVMRSSLRMFVVGSMVLALALNPAYACHYCGGGWGGYYGNYYGGYGYGYDCGGCGGCDGCGVVVDDGCGGCDSCEGVVVEEHGAAAAPELAPQAPPEAPVQPQQPATVDRPIDAEPAPSLPVQPEVETQPVPPADDLFNGTEATTPPPTDEPVVTPPVAEPPAIEEPAEAPATETPAEDDLFGGATEETTPPAETPAEPPAESPATDTPAEDDLFGGATEETTPPADTETPPVEEAPADETPADEETPKAEETDDIFGASDRVLREKGGLASAEMRLWVDNTGTYSCHGRLVKFMDGHVRIMKENGRTTTVPLYRLSPSDLSFVNRQATANKAERFQTAQASNMMLRAAN
jgi:hypothetical protein